MKKTIKIINVFLMMFVLLMMLNPRYVSAQSLKQRYELAKTKYNQARQQYLKEINLYKNARQEFLKTKEKYQQLKNSETKKALENKTRNYLEKTVNSLIKRLEAIKEWVVNRGALEETEKERIIIEIDKDLGWLREKLSKIQATSSEAIKEEAKTLRTYWKTHRLRVKRMIGEIWVARINWLIAKAENLSVKIDSKIQELRVAGKNTTQIEVWLADSNQKLALAKEKYQVAKEKFQAIKSEPGFEPNTEFNQANQLFQEGHQFIKEANHYLKQVHVQLVQIIKEMKKMGQEVVPSGEDLETENP